MNFKEYQWTKFFGVVIVVIIMLIFFVATRDYEKFKLLDRESGGLDPELGLVVEATKECNKFPNEAYKEECYIGVSFSAGYHNFENYSGLCSNLSNKNACYDGATRRIGEEFYNNISLIFEKCASGAGEEERCKYRAIRSAAKVLTYYNKSFEYCKTIEEKSRSACYDGISWGLGNQYYPGIREQLISSCQSLEWRYRRSCVYGLTHTTAEYLAKNPSYAETANQHISQLIQELNSGQSPTLKNIPSISFDTVGFYSGIEHFKEQEVAFSICKNYSRGLGEELKNNCYGSVFRGLGYVYYSELFNKAYSDSK